jgi:gamma-glutamylputrescine oxidase
VIAATTYYRATARPYAPFAPATGNRDARVCIVGGGYAGLNTALSLAERGVRDAVLLEAETIGHGASGRNGGFVFAGYSLGEGSLREQLGTEIARRVYARSVGAVNLIRARIERDAIACDAIDEGVLWANWFRDPAPLRERRELLANSFDTHWDEVAPDELRALVASPRYHGALWERNALHLHPLDYAVGLARSAAARGVHVHEHTRVADIARDGSGFRVSTPDGAIRCETLVLACGGYLAGLSPKIDRSILPIATYVMATEPLGNRLQELFPGTRAAVYDSRFAFDYYRPLADTRVLWGGRISILDRSPAAVATLLKRDLLRVFPQLGDVGVDYAWSGLMSYARHQMPQIATLERNLWCAQGFGGHGLATTAVAGEVLASAIAEDDEAYRDYTRFGFESALKPWGFLGAQATYSWYQFKDWWKAAREGSRAA